jgi:catechol 2,3-dioxygenase-like lactoylglutathione lyase family enzyme
VETCLEHVRANVGDLGRAIEWYTTVLGSEVDSLWPPDHPDYAHFEAAGGATACMARADAT